MALSSTAPSGPPPNEEGMLLLEASFARVPHEELRRHLRTQQRHVERDLAFCTSTLEAVSKGTKSTATAPSSQFPHTASPAALSLPASSSASSVMASGGPSPGDVARDADTSYLPDVSTMSEGDLSLLARESLAAASAAGEDDSQASKREADRMLDVVIARVAGLKRKIASVHDLAGPALTRLDARTQHLAELQAIQSISSPGFDEWCRTRLDRMLVDWLLRKGHLSTADELAKSRDITNYTELSLFAEIARIEASLAGHTDEEGHFLGRSCTPTLAWCSENKAALRKIKSTLEFELRLQEFIEIARLRSIASMQEALLYCRRYLLPYLSLSTKASDDKTQKADEKVDAEDQEQAESLRAAVRRALGLLACGPSSLLYADLFSPIRWESLREAFRKAALQIHGLSRQSTLHIALSAGLSSLKLPACYADEKNGSALPHLGGRAFGDDINKILAASEVTSTSISAPSFPPATGLSVPEAAPAVVVSAPILGSDVPAVTHDHTTHVGKNKNCPVCDAHGLGVLAKEVPWSHHANSTLVCGISGQLMTDTAMALPNGRVYSQSALQEMAAASHDGETVRCPRTGEFYSLKQARKVFIS